MFARLPVMHSAFSLSRIASVVAGNISASQFASEMLAAKPVMDASTVDEIAQQMPAAEALMDSYGFTLPFSKPTSNSNSESEVDEAYFKNVFQPHFASELREVFDRRMSSRGFYVRSHVELRKFASALPDIAQAGLLTFNVVNGYFAEQIESLLQDIRQANGQHNASAASSANVSRKSFYGITALFGTSLCAAALKNDNPVLAAMVAAGAALVIHFVSKTRVPQLTDVEKWAAITTQMAIKEARAKIITNRKDIKAWSQMALPPLS
ncbi:MAG: hypothetical protein ABH871_00410 [Pseudomonadota bacterium]